MLGKAPSRPRVKAKLAAAESTSLGLELFAGPDQMFTISVRQHQEKAVFVVFEKVGRLEWNTLLFFMAAMMGIGGLRYIGYLDAVSQLLQG